MSVAIALARLGLKLSDIAAMRDAFLAALETHNRELLEEL